MHYDLAALKEQSVHVGDGWRKASITLRDGDTSYHPASGKAVFGGAGDIDYYIHPTSVNALSSPGVYEQRIS